MLKIIKKLFSVLLSGLVTISAAAIISGASYSVNAANAEDIAAPSVFVKQQESNTCTLASNVMLLRRTALMRGDSDWKSITENSCRSTLWIEGAGMKFDYTYKNITVSCERFQSSSSIKTQLINLLKDHPEGIVIYDYDYPHAILLTDYTNGEFYCADPANNVSSGRIKASKALIDIYGVESFWYVVTPKVSLGGSSGIPTTIKTVSQYWKITSSNGVNMRSGPGTSYSTVAGVPYNTTIKVTKKTCAGGYTWGYTSYNGINGWVALDYAVYVGEITPSVLTNRSTISSFDINLGDTITIEGSASGGKASYQYEYSYRATSEKSYTVIKNYSTSTSVSFKPSKTEAYKILIKVRDLGGSVVEKYYDITVKAASNNSTISTSTVKLGNSITIKGDVKGNCAPYQYLYQYRYSSDSKYTTIKDYSASASVSFKPSKAGKYKILVNVKDSAGRVVSKYFDINVYKSLPTNKSTVSSFSVSLNSTVTIKGAASGGTSPYQYSYQYRYSSDSEYTTIKGYSTATSASFKPTKSGLYKILINVKDSAGGVVSKYYDLKVN